MKKRKLKKIWVISLTLIAIFLAITGSAAIYTSQVYQRAVVRNRYNDVVRFSSDKLFRVKDASDPKKYYYPVGEGQPEMTFSVCNYDQSYTTLYNEKTINYNIEFKIENGTENIDYIIKCGNEEKGRVRNGNQLTIQGVLDGGKRSVNKYSVNFDDNDYDKIEIKVTVTPVQAEGNVASYYLNGALIPIKYASTQGIRLNTSYVDIIRGTPDKFDAYNLLVSISGGSSKVKIEWINTQLDIDPYFKENKDYMADGELSSVTVSMSSDDDSGTYLITFFNHNSFKPEWTKWDDLPITVTLVNE